MVLDKLLNLTLLNTLLNFVQGKLYCNSPFQMSINETHCALLSNVFVGSTQNTQRKQTVLVIQAAFPFKWRSINDSRKDFVHFLGLCNGHAKFAAIKIVVYHNSSNFRTDMLTVHQKLRV